MTFIYKKKRKKRKKKHIIYCLTNNQALGHKSAERSNNEETVIQML